MTHYEPPLLDMRLPSKHLSEAISSNVTVLNLAENLAEEVGECAFHLI